MRPGSRARPQSGRPAQWSAAGAAKSGKPCARFTAPLATASRVISRITDSVKDDALRDVPLIGRVGGIAAGLAGYLAFRRSLVAGVLLGEAVLIGTAWWATRV